MFRHRGVLQFYNSRLFRIIHGIDPPQLNLLPVIIRLKTIKQFYLISPHNPLGMRYQLPHLPRKVIPYHLQLLQYKLISEVVLQLDTLQC